MKINKDKLNNLNLKSKSQEEKKGNEILGELIVVYVFTR